MKHIYIIFFLSTIFAQVSISDINKLSNQQLDAFKEELQANTKASTSESIPAELNMSSPVSITSTAVAITSEDYFGYNYIVLLEILECFQILYQNTYFSIFATDFW